MSILSPVVTGVMSPVLTGTESNTPFYRWVGAADGTRYIDLDNTITVDGYFKIELTWERKDRDTATGTGTTVLLGSDDEDDGVERLLVNDSNHPTNPNRISFISDGEFRNFPNALDGVEQGQFIKIKLIKDENGLSLLIDGDLKGVKTDSINPFTIDKIGVRSDGLNASKGIIADLKITDYTKLPKGTYLLGDGSAYTQVNIPVEAGDTISFDYVHVTSANPQTLVATAARATSMTAEAANTFSFSPSMYTLLTVDNVTETDGIYTFEQGKKVKIVATVGETQTLTVIGRSGNDNEEVEGTIANFKVTKLNGLTYEYLTKYSIIDNGDGTAIAPQTGDVAEFGDDLLDQSDFVFGDGWSSDGNGLFSCGGTQAANSNLVVYLAEPLDGEQPIYYECSVISQSAGSIATRVGSLAVGSYSSTIGDRSFYYLAPNNTPHVGFRCSSDFIGQVEVKAVYPTTNGLIPVFNPANNLITYASNVVSYPIDEQSGTEVLAYDENGGRYSTYDGEWTPDADHERIVFNQ